jgi:tetratricopeptide (TPR) repeat protein
MRYTPLDTAEAFIKAGELEDALDTLNQYLAETADDEAYRLRAELWLRLTGDDHLQKALADVNTIISLTPDDVMRRSVIYERMGNTAATLDAAANAYRLRPADERFAERYLQLLLAQGKLEDAAALLSQLPTTWRWQQWRGDVAAVRMDWQAAHKNYQTALVSLEANSSFVWAAAVKARLHLALAEVCIHLSDYPQAETHYRAAEQLIPDDSMIAFNRGLLAVLQGDDGQAVRLCREAHSKANETIRAHMATTLRGDARYNGLIAKVLG